MSDGLVKMQIPIVLTAVIGLLMIIEFFFPMPAVEIGSQTAAKIKE